MDQTDNSEDLLGSRGRALWGVLAGAVLLDALLVDHDVSSNRGSLNNTAQHDPGLQPVTLSNELKGRTTESVALIITAPSLRSTSESSAFAEFSTPTATRLVATAISREIAFTSCSNLVSKAARRRGC